MKCKCPSKAPATPDYMSSHCSVQSQFHSQREAARRFSFPYHILRGMLTQWILSKGKESFVTPVTQTLEGTEKIKLGEYKAR